MRRRRFRNSFREWGLSSDPYKFLTAFSYFPLPLKYTTIPATRNAPLLSKDASAHWPVLVFSHGLGGSCNAYSHLLGSLASCGVVCIAPEHRDQSTPISIIRQADGGRKSIPYKHLSHDPNPEILSARNSQLRIRLWELELLYTALEQLNDGKEMKNLANEGAPSLARKLDLTPSKVVQFVKSVFWHQAVPTAKGEGPSKSTFEALYTPAENSSLKRQITPKSPIVLLDLWTMPLRGDATLWLWELPLPCYAEGEPSKNNVLAVMSEEFYKWTTLLDRIKAVLSRHPAGSEGSSGIGVISSGGPRLFYTPKTAHLSQSDFAVLFQWAAKKWLNAEEPERTLVLNTRAVLQLLRENKISVESMKLEENPNVDDPRLADPAILAKNSNIQGWLPIPIG
jgi:platelet-activating factor acetylhydrolase